MIYAEERYNNIMRLLTDKGRPEYFQGDDPP